MEGNITHVQGMSLVRNYASLTKVNDCPRWLTLGNQLGTDQICEPDLLARIKGR